MPALDEVSEDQCRRVFDVNFWGVVNGSLVALPYLVACGGVLINVGSEAPDDALPLQGMYSSSKCAVKGFTEALRVEMEGAERAAVGVALIQPPAGGRRQAGAGAGVPAAPLVDPMEVAQAILQAAVHIGTGTPVRAMPRAFIA